MSDNATQLSGDAHRMAVLSAPDGPFPLVSQDVDGVVLQVFDRDPRTLRDAFLHTAEHGDLTAVVYEDERYTYAQQWEAVVAVAHGLRDRAGVGVGARVAIAMRNYPEYIVHFWAAQVLGAVVVPLNAWLTGAELEPLLAVAAPAVLVADRERLDRLRTTDLAAHGVRTVVGVRAGDPGLRPGPDYVDHAALVAEGAGHDAPPTADVGPDDPATLLFTSGTTGRPKAVVGTHRNHAASLLNKMIRAVPLAPDGRTAAPVPRSTRVLTFPFFHIAGINNLYSAAYPGHCLVLMYKWDVEEALRIVEVERARELAGPPFVMQTFLDAVPHTARDLGSLRNLGMGGSSAPVHLIAAVDRLFEGRVTPRTGYGLTETTGGVVAIGGAEFVAHPDSVGRPLPTVEVGIVDADGTPVPTGHEGEIAIRGPQVVAGYRSDDGPTRFVDGWFRTGDTGRVDEDGRLYLLGRLKDVVIRGGENINCAEVEECLSDHPDVLEAAVFGLPHPTLGEELAAIVRLRPESALDGPALRAHVAARLAAFKVPSVVHVSDRELPRTASGKLVKRGIRAFLPTAPGSDRSASAPLSDAAS